ncbi:MAG: RNA methyltransferase [Caldilineaceae bacterium]|nr:RNA methyltransferase [Caldilineaceae bacterium]
MTRVRNKKKDDGGFFGIGIYQAKHFENVGVLWRGAYQLGAAFIFTVGKRYRPPATDVAMAWIHIPLYNYGSFDECVAALPYSCRLVGVEMGGKPLPGVAHPDRAVYILGAEDGGLPSHVIERCHSLISIPSVRSASYNVAQAGTIVMYDRLVKTSPTVRSSPT